MGLAFFPWEKLPAYMLGPLLLAVGGWLLWSDDHRTFVHVVCEIGGILYALFIIWHRYRTGEEIFAKSKPANKP